MNKEMEYIDELIRLKKENPNARIMCMVDTEELNSDYYRAVADFGKPRLGEYIMWENKIIVDDEDYVKNEICDNLYNDDEINHDTDNEIVERKINKIFNALEQGIGIFINIG